MQDATHQIGAENGKICVSKEKGRGRHFLARPLAGGGATRAGVGAARAAAPEGWDARRALVSTPSFPAECVEHALARRRG